MKGKRFNKGGYTAQVIQWDDTNALWICKFAWSEYFYEDDEYIRENLVED